MRIFYIGDPNPHSTSRHRADALARLGHQVTLFDPVEALAGALGRALGARLHYRSGYRLLQPAVQALVRRRSVEIAAHDVVWVDGGELFGRAAVALLAGLAPTVLVCIDDPGGRRDGRRFDSLIAALPAYDLCAGFRDVTAADFNAAGARRTLRLWMGYDEVAHAPPTQAELAAWPDHGGIGFIGSWMRGEGRDDVIRGLLDRGAPVWVRGDRWPRAGAGRKLGPVWRGGALGGRDYCTAIAAADACLGLVSRGNRDQHTTRSLEIPFIGGVFLGQRTGEHQAMFRDGVEALLWDDLDECADRCRRLAADPARAHDIRAAGMARVRAGGFGNETMTATILAALAAA